MGIPENMLLISAALFFAAMVKSSLGFGESLLAVPILTLVLGVQLAGPLIALIALFMTGGLLFQNWHTIDLREIRILLGAAIVGIPIGVIALKTLPASIATSSLGLVLVSIGLYNLFQPNIRPVQGIGWTLGFGFASGILGGAYNVAGVPIIIYGAMRQWDPSDFRGSLQSYFLVVSLIIVSGHAVSGLWTQQLWQLIVFSTPALLLGYWIGNQISGRISESAAKIAIYIAIVILGATLIL